MRDFRLVQRGEHSEHSDAHTSKKAPTVHVVYVLRSGLDGSADEEDYASGQNCQATAERVSQGADVDIPVECLARRSGMVMRTHDANAPSKRQPVIRPNLVSFGCPVLERKSSLDCEVVLNNTAHCY